jgi:hydroxymethylpyrimidine/phosphomethylpyrimidine kinase
MPTRLIVPAALTIAGSDSGGGAGIQADLKTFGALGVHGASAVTCITAQNPRAVRALQACQPKIVRAQIDAVFAQLRPAAVKAGLLYSAGIVGVVADFFRRSHRPPLIVDPVMVSSSGTRLLRPSGAASLHQLLKLVDLVTPNRAEAEVLSGVRIHSVEDMRTAARLIRSRYRCAVLVKGGHVERDEAAVDIFYDGKTELLLTAPFIKGIALHGAGCTYSAAITAYLALGRDLPQAVQQAKHYITQAIAQSVTVAGHAVLNSFWQSWPRPGKSR